MPKVTQRVGLEVRAASPFSALPYSGSHSPPRVLSMAVSGGAHLRKVALLAVTRCGTRGTGGGESRPCTPTGRARGVSWCWPALLPRRPAASLRLPGGPAPRVFSFSAGMSAGSAGLPAEGRQRVGAPRPRPRLGPGSAVEGARLALQPGAGPGARRASAAEGDTREPKGTPGSRRRRG